MTTKRARQDDHDHDGPYNLTDIVSQQSVDDDASLQLLAHSAPSIARPSDADQRRRPTPMSEVAATDLIKEETGYDASTSSAVLKRSDYLSWDDYFMAIAVLSAHRSKDPHHPAGCCIVDAQQRVVAIGYNGFPIGCDDDCMPWQPSDTWLHSPAPYVVPAAINAVLNKGAADVVGATLYTPHFPNNDCAKILVQSGLRQVVYLHEARPATDTAKASRILMTMAGVDLRQHVPQKTSVMLEFGISTNSEQIVLPIAASVQVAKYQKECQRHGGILHRETGFRIQQSGKRRDYISWDDYFMAMAFLTAQRSKDPNTQVGACLVDEHQRVIGLGYNGFPWGCSDNVLPWARHGSSVLHTKYPYVCHAEVNAVLNKCTPSVRGATLYVALFPCNDCAKLLVQAGIAQVVYLRDIYHDTDACRASRVMFELAGVKMRQYTPSRATIALDLGGSNNG